MSLAKTLEWRSQWEVVQNKNIEKIVWFVEENFSWTKVRQLSSVEKLTFRSTWSIVLDNQLWGWFLRWWAVEVAWKESSGKTSIAVMTWKTMQEEYDLEVLRLILRLIELEEVQLDKNAIKNKLTKLIESTKIWKHTEKFAYFLKLLEACNYKNVSWESQEIVEKIEDIIENKWHILYVDAEWSITSSWSDKMWLDPQKVTVIKCNLIEDIFDQLDTILPQHKFEIIILDSIWAMTPKAEDDSWMEQQTMALKARVLNKAMRKVVFKASNFIDSPIQPTLICINHTYDTMDQWNPVETPGWRWLKFAFSTRLFVNRIWSKYVYAVDEVDENTILEEPDEQIWTFIRFKIVKNKATAPKGQAETKLIFYKPKTIDGEEYDKITIWFNKFDELYDGLKTAWIIEPESSRTWKISFDNVDDAVTEVKYIKAKTDKEWDRFTWYEKDFRNELKFNPAFFDSCLAQYKEANKVETIEFDPDEVNLDEEFAL